ncbi:SPOR domain-containing protein, partial [Myxococcota bacterium]|nr:SPOR domain-containing protein [Myxococcota bacterium]
GGRDASVGPDASKALPAAEPAADAALAGIDVVVGAPAKKGGWGLQVGAYPSLDEARAYVGAHAASLRAFRVHLIPTEITGRGTWHRVRIGYYSSRAEAEVAKKALPSDLASDALVVSYK